MRTWTRIAATATGAVVAAAVFPIGAGAQTAPVAHDNLPGAEQVHGCKVTSKRYGKNGSVGGKCKGSGHFYIRNLCYRSNSPSSDSEFIEGGIAGAPDGTSLAVCRGSYPYMNTDAHVAFWGVS